jgi:hypothetical protein
MTSQRQAVLVALLLACPLAPALGDDATVIPERDRGRVVAADRLDSRHLERELQGLDWEQFRAVIEAIPKLKADVDAYGPAGWEYVKGKYRTHEWRKNIAKLDDDEKRRLAGLIDAARERR